MSCSFSFYNKYSLQTYNGFSYHFSFMSKIPVIWSSWSTQVFREERQLGLISAFCSSKGDSNSLVLHTSGSTLQLWRCDSSFPKGTQLKNCVTFCSISTAYHVGNWESVRVIEIGKGGFHGENYEGALISMLPSVSSSSWWDHVKLFFLILFQSKAELGGFRGPIQRW